MAQNEALSHDDAVREFRVNSRRRQLLDAAVTVMQRTGFHQMSMQALADEAQVSVGLIYKYFAGKDEILFATILDILDAFRDQLEPAMDAVGDDPAERLRAGFRRYVEVVDDNCNAVVLTYRESRTLTAEGRERIKELEVATADPMRAAITTGVDAGVMKCDDVDLVVYDLVMLGHMWALKHWRFRDRYTVEQYADTQLQLVLAALRP